MQINMMEDAQLNIKQRVQSLRGMEYKKHTFVSYERHEAFVIY